MRAGVLFKALIGVVVVAGSAIGACVLVFGRLGGHGDNTVPLLCALSSAVVAGMTAAYLVRRLLR